jgi:hypothetical protein
LVSRPPIKSSSSRARLDLESRMQLRTNSADTLVMFRIGAFERNLVPLTGENSTRRANSLESCQVIGRF